MLTEEGRVDCYISKSHFVGLYTRKFPFKCPHIFPTSSHYYTYKQTSQPLLDSSSSQIQSLTQQCAVRIHGCMSTTKSQTPEWNAPLATFHLLFDWKWKRLCTDFGFVLSPAASASCQRRKRRRRRSRQTRQRRKHKGRERWQAALKQLSLCAELLLLMKLVFTQICLVMIFTSSDCSFWPLRGSCWNDQSWDYSWQKVLFAQTGRKSHI